MDNLENGGTSDPQGTVDVAVSSGQSAGIETQPLDGVPEGESASQPENETGVAEVSQQPWDKDERFKGKTSDEMYEIVREADRYKGELGQKAKVADMLSKQFGLTPERMEEIAHERADASRQREIEANPVAAVYDKVQQLEQELVIRDEDAKLEKFLSLKPEYGNFRNEIRDLGYSVDRDKSWDQIAERYFGKAIRSGQEAAYHQIDVKQKTQATGVSRGDVKPSVTLEDLSKMSSNEMESYLKKAS